MNMAYRKGFSWNWQDAATLAAHAALLAEAGFDGLEPVFGSPLFEGDAEKTARDLCRRCADLGLAIPSLRGGRYFWQAVSSPDKAARAQGLDYGRRALDALAAMGGSVLLVVPGGKRPDVRYEEHWKYAREFFLALGEEAAARHLRAAAENVECGFPLSVLEWRTFLGEIAGPGTGMYLDAGNVVCLDYGFPEHWITTLARHIAQVHFKGAKRGGPQCSLWDGDVDWTAVMRALRTAEYAGWILVEPPGMAAQALHHYFRSLAEDMEVIFQLA
jgi:hexulose-6-phosphate isomerase